MTNNGKIRTFIAIDIPPRIKQDIARVNSVLQRNLPNHLVRWVPLENIHLTLRFLGDITQSQLYSLVSGLQPILDKLPILNTTVTGIGAFPNIHKARVLWIGLQISPDLSPILDEMDQKIRKAGITFDERMFSPHLTISRVSHKASLADYYKIESVITNTDVGVLGKFQVQSIKIYKSDLSKNGAVYTCLYSIPRH